MCGNSAIPREIEDSQILDELGVKKEALAAMRKPQEFFKHADRDSTDSVRFSPMLSVCLLIYCVQFLYALARKTLPEGQALRAWFYVNHPERLPVEASDLKHWCKT
jgi:hypothetical protein